MANLLTMINAFLGFIAILQATRGRFEAAFLLILLAAIADLSDGFLARRGSTPSRFGLEADSLADVVSFGVAPSSLIYAAVFHSWGIFGVLVSSMPLLCGALRLARFNVMNATRTEGPKTYLGLSIPPAGLIIASYVLFADSLWGEPRYTGAFAVVVLMVSAMMVSRIEYKHPRVFLLTPRRYLLTSVVGLLLVLYVHLPRLLFPIGMGYAFSGIVEEIAKQRRLGRKSVAMLFAYTVSSLVHISVLLDTEAVTSHSHQQDVD